MAVIFMWSIFLTVIKYLPNEALSPFTACLLKERHLFKTCLSLTVENESQVYAQDQMEAIIFFSQVLKVIQRRDEVPLSPAAPGSFTPIITVTVQGYLVYQRLECVSLKFSICWENVPVRQQAIVSQAFAHKHQKTCSIFLKLLIYLIDATTFLTSQSSSIGMMICKLQTRKNSYLNAVFQKISSTF